MSSDGSHLFVDRKSLQFRPYFYSQLQFRAMSIRLKRRPIKNIR